MENSRFQCTLGGGNHGLLGLIISDATYLLVSNTTCVHPPNPDLLSHILTDTTTAISYELVRQHKAALQMFHEVQHTDRALKQQFIKTFNAIYIDDLRDPNIGFTSTTAITHLYDCFGKSLLWTSPKTTRLWLVHMIRRLPSQNCFRKSRTQLRMRRRTKHRSPSLKHFKILSTYTYHRNLRRRLPLLETSPDYRAHLD